MMQMSDNTPAAASAYELAYGFLRTGIKEGRLKRGERVKAEDIAAQLGISRMPVREAIRQLDSEGLLTIRPNRGPVVTVLSAEQILELFEMRAALEGLAIRRAAPRFTVDDFDELELRLRCLERAKNDSDQRLVHHDAFHDLICQRSGGEFLATEVKRLRTLIEPYLRIELADADPDGFAAEHRELLEALRGGDAAHCEAVMHEHIVSTAHALIRAMTAASAVSTS